MNLKYEVVDHRNPGHPETCNNPRFEILRPDGEQHSTGDDRLSLTTEVRDLNAMLKAPNEVRTGCRVAEFLNVHASNGNVLFRMVATTLLDHKEWPVRPDFVRWLGTPDALKGGGNPVVVWIDKQGTVHGRVSDEQIIVVLEQALLKVYERSGLDRATRLVSEVEK